ncbi:MAG: hypothetical protein IKW31_01265 [Alistipes sp.]|jgi:hypothetical protein|nr:hypothetical protein [Alistipes sp.]
MQRLIYLAIVALSALCVACNEPQHSIEMHDMDEAVWSNAEEFTYDNQDSLSKRDISIVVRYGSDYVADSVSLRILAISPDSLVTEEPFTLRIPRIKEVRPEEQTFLYRKDVVLGRCGEYTFRITPDTLVEGISSVGLMIGETERE